jgi:hypothetical protein
VLLHGGGPGGRADARDLALGELRCVQRVASSGGYLAREGLLEEVDAYA